jgi:hypothetical protein
MEKRSMNSMDALNGGNGVVLEVELLQTGERDVPYLNEY